VEVDLREGQGGRGGGTFAEDVERWSEGGTVDEEVDSVAMGGVEGTVGGVGGATEGWDVIVSVPGREENMGVGGNAPISFNKQSGSKEEEEEEGGQIGNIEGSVSMAVALNEQGGVDTEVEVREVHGRGTAVRPQMSVCVSVLCALSDSGHLNVFKKNKNKK
jgi:hypothetical protein